MDVTPLSRLFVAGIVTAQFMNIRLNVADAVVTRIAPPQGTAEIHLYLPTVSYKLPLQLQITAMEVYTEDPGGIDERIYGYVIGNVINTSPEPLYGTELAVTIKATYNNSTTFRMATFPMWTAFTNTLPSQANPFAFFSDGFGYYTYERVEVVGVEVERARPQSPSDPVFVALNTSDWSTRPITSSAGYGFQEVVGTIRNDSALPVTNIYAFIVEQHRYPEFLGIAQETVIQPGAVITYHGLVDIFETVTGVVAQGMFSP